VANGERKAVRKAYGAAAVAHSISIDARDGDPVPLVRTSGSGKSTLLRVIAGLAGITGRETMTGGRTSERGFAERCDIAAVFQNDASGLRATVEKYPCNTRPLSARHFELLAVLALC